MTSVAAKVTVGVLALLLVGAAQEYAIRFTLPAFDPSGHVRFIKDERSGLNLGRPRSVQRQIMNAGDYDVSIHFNRYGLRDKRDITKGTAEDYYVVGDSFTFGWGVEENQRFSSQLEVLTGRRTYNLATPADFDGYLQLISDAETRGAKIRHVILAVNSIDDIVDYEAKAARQRKDADRSDSTPTGNGGIGLMSIKHFLLARSSLYFLVTSLVHRTGWLKDQLTRMGIIIPIRTMLSGLPDARAINSAARKLVELDRRYDLTVLIIPSRGLWVGDRRDDVDRAHKAFVARLRERGLKPVDLRPILEKDGAPMSYHFANDGHWRPRGHKAAAQALAAALGSK